MDPKSFQYLPGTAYVQHYQDLVREAEKQRLVQELGISGAGTLRTFVHRLWIKLLQVMSRKRSEARQLTYTYREPGL